MPPSSGCNTVEKSSNKIFISTYKMRYDDTSTQIKQNKDKNKEN